MMPLGLLNAGDTAEIADLNGYWRKKAEYAKEVSPDTRAEDIGIRAGKIVEMLNNGGRGPLLIKVDESRIAIARGMAMKIMVRREEK